MPIGMKVRDGIGISFMLISILSCFGLFFIFSATHTAACPFSLYVKKQSAGILIGTLLYWFFAYCDYRALMRWSYFAYFFLIGLLIFTLIKGSIGMGAQRWINLFFFKLQPSELAKPLFPAFVVYYFYTHRETSTYSLKDFMPLLGMLGLSCLLIIKQPDLGTALIILFSGMILFWLAGLSRTFFLYALIVSMVSAPILWHFLKPYQKSRIAVFLGYGTTHNERYQIEQATIAIGSGGLMGKGFLKGTQNTLQFLPESRTDFIFAVLCEEWGFIGTSLILFLYALLFIRILYLIMFIKLAYIQLLAIGLLIPLILSTFINIFMVIGLLPIVGIPLPFMSYGLTHLLISYASLGWIAGIYRQQ